MIEYLVSNKNSNIIYTKFYGEIPDSEWDKLNEFYQEWRDKDKKYIIVAELTPSFIITGIGFIEKLTSFLKEISATVEIHYICGLKLYHQFFLNLFMKRVREFEYNLVISKPVSQVQEILNVRLFEFEKIAEFEA
jgi:hypothetical protein